MVKKILITGSNSYLGSYIVGNDNQNQYFALSGRKINNKNIDSIDRISEIKKQDINYLYHFANFQTKNGDYEAKEEVKFLNEAIKYGISNILYSNTYWTEIDQYKYSDYVQHKITIEKALFEIASKNNDLSICIMMLGDIYGPDDFRKKLIPYLLNSEMEKEVILENNEGAEICLINIKDIFNFISDLGFDNGFEKVDLIGSIETLSNVVELFKQSRGISFKAIYKNIKTEPLNYKSKSDSVLSLKISLEQGFKNLK